jgi:zinc/manganese transport system permease protein
MLGLGALFVSLNVEYGPEVYSLLFGEVLGVSTSQLIPTAGLAVLCVIAIALLYRPLMLSSLLPDVAEARGIATARIDLLFLAVVALSTTARNKSRRYPAHLQSDDRRASRRPFVHR